MSQNAVLCGCGLNFKHFFFTLKQVLIAYSNISRLCFVETTPLRMCDAMNSFAPRNRTWNLMFKRPTLYFTTSYTNTLTLFIIKNYKKILMNNNQWLRKPVVSEKEHSTTV